ncbi:transmembrane prolyl 4-hydroxylase-like [Dendronephthya gigantea]|uniref:transmembrane prolyl 4-hydroxylase-like n=1 Tax=Dendronephthya gigantea TaxID=151771 RepID=UPI00106B3EA8|nr:transmembrane prolyl 4-hydroxylase-like [Dendronephthya gigantea]
MSKQFLDIPDIRFWVLVSILHSTMLSCADHIQPLSTKDFYKQIYGNVCPSGELSCLREVMTNTFQMSLTRKQKEKVGMQETIHLFEGKENIVKTLSQNPPIFEIKDFFTKDECELVIDLAKAKGMKKIPPFKNIEKMFKDEMHETFKMWNLNGDDFIDAYEVSYVYGKAGIFVNDKDIYDMFKDCKIDNDDNGKLDKNEFGDMDKERTAKWLEKHIADSEISKPDNVFMQQTWLWHNEDELLAYEDLFENYHERVAKVSMLPKKIVENSEPIQVVKYETGAHYDCHHDTQSLSNELPCCQYGSSNCRLCRYLTIMVFLTDNYEGGEKCFPLADNKTFSQKDLPREYLEKCNLAKSCNKCNLLVKPKQGKALLWYNHLLNTKTSWMGALDAFSSHGDCVSDGEKWIANIWIDIIGDGKHELRSWKSGTNWIKPGNKKDAEIYTYLGNPDLKQSSNYTQFKERYSPVMNTKPETNTDFQETRSGKNLGHSKILQSVLLLLAELKQDELYIVADKLRKEMTPRRFLEIFCKTHT